MNNTTVTEIAITLSDGTTKSIKVSADGLVLILNGRAKKFKDVTECSVRELLTNAKSKTEAQVPKKTTDNANDPYKHSFDKAVDFLAHCKGEDFLELVRYARAHGNTFFNCVKEVADCVNADDAYCSALILLARPLGDAAERRAFELFDAATKENAEEDFIDFWRALQVINYFC